MTTSTGIFGVGLVFSAIITSVMLIRYHRNKLQQMRVRTLLDASPRKWLD